MRILHAIHDFLPRHQAGSEVYAFDLCRELTARHHVTVLCAEYDPSRRHGHVTWRVHQGIPVVEIVNNWVCASFEETYRSPLVSDRIAEILRAVQPDIIHIHNLLNLSFDLPSVARGRGVPVVATLHDYALVCPAGGQRIHRAEQHLCRVIDTERCARCFKESPFYTQISFGRLAALTRAPGLMRRAAVAMSRWFPRLTGQVVRAARHAPLLAVTRRDIDDRLAAARRVLDEVDLFVAPSRAIAADFQQLGIAASKIRISDYGFAPLLRNSPSAGPKDPPDNRDRPWGHGEAPGPLRLGYVGTLVWHKGVHVLLDAIRSLPAAGYEVKIFGDPDVFPEYTAELRARAAGLPVTFMGAFDRGRVADVYAQIDVLVVPSLWLENSPLVIHEAYMAGVPVVGARIGGIPDLIDEGRTGLLYDPASPTDLAAALRGLLEDPERVRAFARTAPSIKSIAHDAQEWEAVYADALRRRAGDGRVA
ncbi:MAG: glycosyltransferase family 4 protein [Acidobacteria bacterium]|nr:glycosyltransferase family 4 protein [Acidobacteriota bacterium]